MTKIFATSVMRLLFPIMRGRKNRDANLDLVLELSNEQTHHMIARSIARTWLPKTYWPLDQKMVKLKTFFF